MDEELRLMTLGEPQNPPSRLESVCGWLCHVLAPNMNKMLANGFASTQLLFHQVNTALPEQADVAQFLPTGMSSEAQSIVKDVTYTYKSGVPKLFFEQGWLSNNIQNNVGSY